MVKQSMDLLELLRKRGMDGDVDFLREALRVLVDGIMDAEVSAQIGAQHGERSPERVTYRNRTWDTRVGTMELHIPKLREGSYFPSLLEPRRRSEKALLSVIQQAYVEGVSTRRVDDLIQALGCDGISSSQVSRICEQLDEVVESFLGRSLDGGPYPYVWLDGLTQKVREGGRIVNVCVVVATGVNAEGQREILGLDVGTSEDGAFWLAFLRSLTARGLSGVELVTSDAHQGLKNAIAAVFAGTGWQRCRTHFMANLLTRVPKRAQPGVATMVRTIYQQLSPAEVHGQLGRVVGQLREPFPQVAELLADAAPDILAFTAFPVAHWQKLDFAHFKRRKQGNRQVGGTERPGLSVYQGRRRTVKNPRTPATGGGAPERWHPRRSATAWRTKPLCDGPRVVVAAADGPPGWSRRRAPSGSAWCERWPDPTTGAGSPRPDAPAPPGR